MDIHTKSMQLLDSLVNSIYDRNKTHITPDLLGIAELHIVENWLRKILDDYTPK